MKMETPKTLSLGECHKKRCSFAKQELGGPWHPTRRKNKCRIHHHDLTPPNTHALDLAREGCEVLHIVNEQVNFSACPRPSGSLKRRPHRVRCFHLRVHIFMRTYEYAEMLVCRRLRTSKAIHERTYAPACSPATITSKITQQDKIYTQNAPPLAWTRVVTATLSCANACLVCFPRLPNACPTLAPRTTTSRIPRPGHSSMNAGDEPNLGPPARRRPEDRPWKTPTPAC